MPDSIADNIRPWRIQLFGAFVVEKPTGERVTLAVKKAGELLAFLALSPHQAHRREKLVSLLWDDAEIGSARTRLRQEILKLRAQFAADADPFPLLLITPDELQLQPETQVDAVRFLMACAGAKQATEWEDRRRLYAEARSLYRADLLVEYDALWIAAERARFSQLYAQALRDGAELHRQRQDYAGAEEALQCLLAHDAGLEESHIALMRLYAEQGQPGRVQQQYRALERMVRETQGAPPTVDIRRLAESLRADAIRQAADQSLPPLNGHLHRIGAQTPADGIDASEPLPTPVALPSPAEVTALPLPNVAPPNTGRRRASLRLALALMVFVCAVGLWLLRPAHTARPHVPSVPALTRHQERWTYLYQPRTGEKPNAEGTAIAADETGIYVTGFIDTDREDTDILTIKLSPDGKTERWVDRYSSPEHDCDRAYSICRNEHIGSIFVAGETWVPPHQGDPGGWHLTLLRYGTNGHRRWVRRSELPMQNEGHRVQVCSDQQEGCYLGGTALVGGKRVMLLLHYEASGRLLWQTMIGEGKRTTFSDLGAGSDGRLYCCGTTRRGAGGSTVNDDWMIACLNPHDGKVLWRRLEDGPAHGNDSAERLLLDRTDNVYVAGLFDTGDLAGGGQGLKLAVERLDPDDGTRLWRRMVPDSGPAVDLESLALNFQGNVAVGGTEHRPDGTEGIVLARLDTLGNLNQTWRYPLPPGYRSARIQALALGDNEEMRFLGQISTDTGPEMHLSSSVLWGTCSHDGRLVNQSLFDRGPRASNHVNAFTYLQQNGLVAVGQSDLLDGRNSLCVLRY